MNIPEAMIEAVAIAGYGDRETWDRWADEEIRESFIREARALVAAAFSSCTIREEWRAKISYSDGTIDYTAWYLDHDAARDSGEYVRRNHFVATVTVERRLVIETAPEPADTLDPKETP